MFSGIAIICKESKWEKEMFLIKASMAFFLIKAGTELTLFPTGRTEYVIPDGTLSVGMSAFAYAQHLLSVTIPDGLHTIYSGAFLYCSNLSKIYSVPSTPRYVTVIYSLWE